VFLNMSAGRAVALLGIPRSISTRQSSAAPLIHRARWHCGCSVEYVDDKDKYKFINSKFCLDHLEAFLTAAPVDEFVVTASAQVDRLFLK
jgi:hypothetical protein